MELSKDQRKAILTIKNYLNVGTNRKYSDAYMMKSFELAIDELVESSLVIKSFKTTGIKSKSDGVQSITFENNIEAWTITDNVRALLPSPFIRMF
ncbi:hypothetical protein LGL08_20540 [Clostridium estertheticum]|uniref:hypothetical protein n=1 Tax=Clostridium estertheticum TaxID=238834 RepID=UPI001CF30CBA|nr:hypothetical protein [Clostridium estertheticum]MCB2308828.1 hypothetical protein [Clostridium estertheticum]MCB2347316.1 hypothetical protein [Clostridium estertheticum]MCB2351918.1 hypothetical protein [Clostridium estertheticum]WAG48515.1 hypothetical protein LL127_23260 [Clostridium estertheticum]